MGRCFFILFLAMIAGRLWAATPVERLELSTDAKEWNVKRFFSRPNANAVVTNTVVDGAQVLQVTFQKSDGVTDMSPSVYRFFPKPVDTGKYTNLRFQIRFSAPTSTANISFYYIGWDKQGWKKIQGVSLTDAVRSKILPADKWLEIDTACRDKPVQWLFIGVRVADFKPGQKLVAELKGIEFYKPGVDASVADQRAEWKTFVKNFKVDGSDGGDLMKPPETHRFDTPVAIVKDGQPMAEIFYEKSCNGEVVKTAAEELQRHIELITGVKIPINTPLQKEGVT